MSIFTEILSILGLGFNTFIHKLDIGNSYKRKRCKESDQFVHFKDQGTKYIILKTVPPKVDYRGNKHFYMMEADIHVFDPESGKVLDDRLEKEFKKRLLKNELEKFSDLMKDAQEEAIAERAKELYDTMQVKTKKADGKEEVVLGEEGNELVEIEFNVPTIKIGTTIATKINNLTPHDTINEVISMILDGVVLKNLITPIKMEWKTIVGILIVGICMGYISVIMYAVFFPEQFRDLVGLGQTGTNLIRLNRG